MSDDTTDMLKALVLYVIAFVAFGIIYMILYPDAPDWSRFLVGLLGVIVSNAQIRN